MGTALKGVPVEEPSVPEGLVNIGGEWFYEEYTASTGVKELSPDAEDRSTPAPTSPEEKKGILDLFGNSSNKNE